MLANAVKTGDPVTARLQQMPLADDRLLAVEAGTQESQGPPGAARKFSRVAVVEIHDGSDD